MKFLLRSSRWLHKYVGLLLILYGTLMGATGILVNHPDWIAGWSVPRWLVPSQYRPKGFNRGTLSKLVYSARDPEQAFLAGSEGVWKTNDGARTFRPLGEGFPSAAAERQTNAIFLDEGATPRLLAGTDAGLHVCDPEGERWRHVPLGEETQPVRSILALNGSLLVFTTSSVWRSPREGELAFRPVEVTRVIPASSERDISLITFLFDLHSGALFGLPGKLLFDLAGITIVILCLSAFYLWYFPWRRRRQLKASIRPGPTVGRSMFRSLLKYHLKIGIWVGPILLVMAGTGLFMRPPLLLIPAQGRVPAAWHPGLPQLESWEGRIHRAVHDPSRGRILIESIDGFWASDEGLRQPFEAVEFPLPIHVMGSTTLTTEPSGGLIAGSFSGGFRLEPDSERITDLISTLR